jgi:hypothetical protein
MLAHGGKFPVAAIAKIWFSDVNHTAVGVAGDGPIAAALQRSAGLSGLGSPPVRRGRSGGDETL